MKHHIQQSFATFVLSALFGAVGMLLYMGHELNTLYIQVSQLKMDNNELQMENQAFLLQSKSISAQRTIQTVETTVSAPDDVVALAGRQYVQRQLAFLIGKPLAILQSHPDLPLRILDGQMLYVDKAKYRIRVQTVIVSDSVQVLVKLSQVS